MTLIGDAVRKEVRAATKIAQFNQLGVASVILQALVVILFKFDQINPFVEPQCLEAGRLILSPPHALRL